MSMRAIKTSANVREADVPGFVSKTHVVEAAILRAIRQGRYGRRLPTVIEMAAEHAVNFKTVGKAVASLVGKGYLESTRGRGTFVTADGAARIAAWKDVPSNERMVFLFMNEKGDVYGRMYTRLVGALNEARFLPIAVQNENRADILRSIARVRPAAVVIDRSWNDFPFDEYERLDPQAWRTVYVERLEYEPCQPFDSVLSDSMYGAYLATRHLIARNHRRILRLGYSMATLPAMIHRLHPSFQIDQGYRLALEEAGLQAYENRLDQVGDPEVDAARLLDVLRDPGNRPTAIFSHGDFRLADAWPVIRAAGLRVPEDLALVGYFNTPHCEHMPVPLTSVSIREEEIGALAARRIIDGDPSHKHVLIKPDLVVRASSGR